MGKIQQNALARQFYKLAAKVQSPKLSKLLFATVHRKFGGCLKYLVSGGAALDPVVCRQFTTLGFEVLEGYGMTECFAPATMSNLADYRIGTVGRPLPGVDMHPEGNAGR